MVFSFHRRAGPVFALSMRSVNKFKASTSKEGNRSKWKIPAITYLPYPYHLPLFYWHWLAFKPNFLEHGFKGENDGNFYFDGNIGIVSTILVFRQPGYEVNFHMLISQIFVELI